jgi:hypothetical protein
MASHAGGRMCRFNSGVSGAHDDHIESHGECYLPMQKCLKM